MKEKMCCKHEYEFGRYCGAYVCIKCGDHKGLIRCYCGRSATRPGARTQELLECGGVIDED